jgi:HAD superfamily hydrolase (TIGR01549 family)
MIKAVLLDLDDTLIRNPNQGFVPRYLHLVDHYFEERWGQKIAKTLISSVRGMMSSVRDMQHSNLHLALQMLHEETGKPLEEIHAALYEFYTQAYPQLQSCTEKITGAAELVEDLQARDYSVVIATNPVYPAEAIRQRLTWAGLSGNFDDYAFVSRADNMHFAKPHPAYYAEILGRIGVEPDEALMVGDNVENDIIPAALIGMHTCHVAPGEFALFTSQISQLETWMPHSTTPEAIIPQLQGNVGALFGLIENIQPHFWMQHPEPDEWSPIEIICHLLERETSVHRARLMRIQREQNPFITDPGSPPHPREVEPCDEGYHAAERFLSERTTTIGFLEQLSQSEWQRPARHSIFGPTTLLEMALFTAQHDRLHLKQLCRTIGKCE